MRSWSIGRISGIPVRLHGSLLVFLPLFALGAIPPGAGLEGVLWGCLYAALVFACILLHELGHGIVARLQGAQILDIVLLPIGGMARIVRMSRRPRDEALMAAAGPAVSLLLAAAAYFLVPVLFAVNPWLGLLSWSLFRTNLMLGLFNLIPSLPMDGGRIFRAVLTPRLGHLRATRIASWTARAIAILFAVQAVRPWFRGGTVDIMLLVIALFVYQSAAAELRQAEAAASAASGNAPPPAPF